MNITDAILLTAQQMTRVTPKSGRTAPSDETYVKYVQDISYALENRLQPIHATPLYRKTQAAFMRNLAL